MYSLFYTVEPSGIPLQLQRYNKYFTYARNFAIYCKINRLSEAK